jgi:hypothetical protein
MLLETESEFFMYVYCMVRIFKETMLHSLGFMLLFLPEGYITSCNNIIEVSAEECT